MIGAHVVAVARIQWAGGGNGDGDDHDHQHRERRQRFMAGRAQHQVDIINLFFMRSTSAEELSSS